MAHYHFALFLQVIKISPGVIPLPPYSSLFSKALSGPFSLVLLLAFSLILSLLVHQ